MIESQITVNRWIVLGAILAGLSVAAGAFAAHFLDRVFAEKYAGGERRIAGERISQARKFLDDFKTGAEYQMTHSLALIAVGILSERRKSRAITFAGWAFTAGILLFSGSLYALTLTGWTKLGMVTPLGGVSFLIGWAALAVAACSRLAFPSAEMRDQ
jgi:uncharacterized membrane protein YgdD (TMEM256/DUF423 family)